MNKTVYTVLCLFAVFVSSALFATPKSKITYQKATPELEQRFFEKIKNVASLPVAEATPNEIGRTYYDFSTFSVMGRMMAWGINGGSYGNGLHFIFMKVYPMPEPEDTLFVTYDYWDERGFFASNVSIAENRRTGWGRIINGKNDEVLGVMHGGGIAYFSDSGEGDYQFSDTTLAEGVFPSIDANGDNIIVAGDVGFGDVFQYSTDYGQTWTAGSLAGFLDPRSDRLQTQPEVWVQFNPANPGEIGYVSVEANVDNNTNPFAGRLVWWTTSDFGVTWQGTLIYDEATFSNPDNSVYLLENFAQYNNFYTSDGVHHVAANGFGVLDITDPNTTIIYPIVYWNTRDRQWIEITSEEAGRPDPANINLNDALAVWRPGNGIGNAYPIMSQQLGGQAMIMAWQQWEADETNEVGLNFTIGSAGRAIFNTNIWGAYSPDGGATWSEPFYLTGEDGVSDVFPNLPRYFMEEGDLIHFDLMYLIDPDPGVSLSPLSQNGPSEGAWQYERISINKNDIGIPTGIEDFYAGAVEDFALAQNFPNPFNPSTNIAFSLKNAAEITLEVFDVSGQKVTTLVKGHQAAGDYNVVFDAAEHVSGIYFYKLTADHFVRTRKMVLIK